MQLTDASLPEAEEQRIRKIIESVPEVKGCHCLRTVSYTHLDVYKRQRLEGPLLPRYD